jgi:RND family efflux transporter MFP subunit
MKQKSIYLLLSVLLLTACNPKYDTIYPKVAPITDAVFASGSIEPQDVYMLNSFYDGYLAKSYVTENDVVHEGQVLFRLDNKQPQVQVQQARNNVEIAKVNISASSPVLMQAMSQVNQARDKERNDSMTFRRFEKLYATNSVSKQDYDNAKLNYETSVNTYKQAIESYRSTQLKVKQDYDNSVSQLQSAEASNQYYELTAAANGRVYQIFKKQGDLVKKGEQVAQLGNKDSLVITLDIDEGTIKKIALGQPVLIELNTQKNTTYEAKVSKIYPHFDDKTQSYKVEAKFVQPVPGLIAGTQLQANIITARKDNAMLIPHTYLMADNKVLVDRNGKKDTVKVTTGIVSDEWIEITNGLSKDDKIMKQR